MTTTSTTITDLATATPAEVDTRLAALYEALARIDGRITSLVNDAHSLVGDTRQYRGRARMWTMTGPEAVTALRALATATDHPRPWTVRDAAATVAKLDEAHAQRAANLDAQAPLRAEFAHRPWSRYFLVTSSDGHIHSSMGCQTCRPTTTYGWLPKMSGQDEATALAELADAAHVMCSACFPNAPVEWTVKRPSADHCAGSGQSFVAGTFVRRSYRSTYGKCPVCHDTIQTTQAGAVRKHKAPKGK